MRAREHRGGGGAERRGSASARGRAPTLHYGGKWIRSGQEVGLARRRQGEVSAAAAREFKVLLAKELHQARGSSPARLAERGVEGSGGG